jgi:uncharacterized protein (TIGR02466 family)
MELNYHGYFTTPIYDVYLPNFVKPLNKVSDKYIKLAQNKNKVFIKEREKTFKKKVGDMNLVHHSESLLDKAEFQDLKKIIFNTSNTILKQMGYHFDIKNLIYTDMWVQEFSRRGVGCHEKHLHAHCHISGFYFLKCSEKTSFPYFQDPRPGKNMSQLLEHNKNNITFASDQVNYKPKPGTLLLFPSYLEHAFSSDCGADPFRFIHFNLKVF